MATVPAAPRAFGGCGLSAAHRHRLFASRRFPLCRNPTGRFAARPGKGSGTLPAVCRPHSSRKATALQSMPMGFFRYSVFRRIAFISAAHFLRSFFTPFSGWPLAMASIPSARLAGKAPLLESTAARSGASAPDITIILKAGSL